MKTKLVIIISILLLFTLSTTHADIGLGIILGEPTGLSCIFENFIALGLAWSLENYIHIHVDCWLLHKDLYESFMWFIGAGGKLKIFTELSNRQEQDTSFALGIRIPVGVQFVFEEHFELFIEAAPGVQLYPATEFDIDAGLGLRFHF